ncbi:MAG: FIST N-terminal domain-containing protein [Thermodesulfobacteriota bacterium]|nr:FIST N-terminal domain-containing protein [Thermodesulfobacteriota bacterium]
MKRLIFSLSIAIVICFNLHGVVRAQNIQVGYGWSTDNNETKAVEQAVNMMTEGVETPELVILYTTVGYDVERIHEILRKKLGKSTQVFGMTSCWGVVTRDGIKVGEKGSLAVLGMTSPVSEFGVGGAQVNSGDDIRSKAAEGIRKAILNAGKSEGSKPNLVLIAASPGIEEEVLKGIAEAVGKDIPVYGGSAADNTISGNWKVFHNNQIYSSGFSVAAIFTELKTGHAYHSGYLGSDMNGLATKVKNGEGRVLQEIDGKPAADVYNEWAYNKYDKQLKEGGTILGPASFYPLARKVYAEGMTHFIGIHPSEIYPEDRSLQLFANVKQGERLYFTEGTPNALIYRPRTIIRRALVNGRIKKKDAALGLNIYCAGTMLAVKDRIAEIVPIINQTLGKTPYIGAFTFGEQGNIKGYGNFHGNLMSSMVIMGSEK